VVLGSTRTSEFRAGFGVLKTFHGTSLFNGDTARFVAIRINERFSLVGFIDRRARLLNATNKRVDALGNMTAIVINLNCRSFLNKHRSKKSTSNFKKIFSINISSVSS
jgi:hypothetical protein